MNLASRRLLVSLVFLGLGLPSCGGSRRPPQDPSSTAPPLDDEGGSAAETPSTPKVKAGVDAIQAGDFGKARALLEEAVAADPKDPQAAFYLGVALEGAGDGKGAVTQYRKALSLDPKLVEASANLSGALLDQGDSRGALEVAERGLRVAPRNGSLLRNRAVALDAAGSQDAAGAFQKAISAAPKDEELHYLYAEHLARTGEPRKALAELTPLTSSDDVAVLASAARLLGKLKAWGECIGALDRAIGKQDLAELRVDRGLCKHGKKDDVGARADFEAAVKVDPKFAPAHYYLGMQLRMGGDSKGARAELQKAADLDPQGALGAAAKKELSELK